MAEQSTPRSEASASEGGAGAPPDTAAPNRAPDLTREYVGDGIAVQWYAARCIHSANCVRALPHVFDPRRRPWVELAGAAADEVQRAVLRCPSGALHFTRLDGGAPESPEVPTTVTPMAFGPLYLRGDVEVRDPAGGTIRHDTRMALCRCAKSRHAPFCDNGCRAPAPARSE